MKREVSSRLTFVAKIVIPGLWISVWVVMTLTALVGLDGRTGPPPLLGNAKTSESIEKLLSVTGQCLVNSIAEKLQRGGGLKL